MNNPALSTQELEAAALLAKTYGTNKFTIMLLEERGDLNEDRITAIRDANQELEELIRRKIRTGLALQEQGE